MSQRRFIGSSLELVAWARRNLPGGPSQARWVDASRVLGGSFEPVETIRTD